MKYKIYVSSVNGLFGSFEYESDFIPRKGDFIEFDSIDLYSYVQLKVSQVTIKYDKDFNQEVYLNLIAKI